MTSKNNEFIEYLSIVDSIHDFGKLRCKKISEEGESEYNNFIEYIKLINKLYADRTDYIKFQSKGFEGEYVNNWLSDKKVPIKTITGKNLFNRFKKIYNIDKNHSLSPKPLLS